MKDQNLFEKLVSISPGMEIWWDSSPMIFDNWCRKIMNNASGDNLEPLRRQLLRMVDKENPANQLFRGVTTNPSLSLQAINNDMPFWQSVAGEIIYTFPDIDEETLFWALYKRVVALSAEIYMPLFEISGYKEGFISAQVDPRRCFDAFGMLRQAEELAAISSNVMVKIPGTREGYEVIEQLTAKGIPTNNTMTFVLPQLIDCANTVKKGLEKAKRNGVDLTRWRSVITHMESRFGDLGGLREHASGIGIDLSEAEVRLAELAIFKKAYHYLKSNDLPSKMLSCSLRLGPQVNGTKRIWHLEEKTGADIVMTCPPVFIEQVLIFPDRNKIELEPDRISIPVPTNVIEKLLRIPYFEKAYAENGYTRDEYNFHPALEKTAKQFSEATEEMVKFAAQCLSQQKDAKQRFTTHHSADCARTDAPEIYV